MIATYTFPHLLLSATREGDFIHCSVREGGPRQVEFTTVFEESDEEPTLPELFRLKGTNEVNVAGKTITVLNDANEVLGIPASSPSLSEYQALIGTSVIIAARANKPPCPPGKPCKWKLSKTTIVLQ